MSKAMRQGKVQGRSMESQEQWKDTERRTTLERKEEWEYYGEIKEDRLFPPYNWGGYRVLVI